MVRGLGTGLALLLANPGAMVTWIVIVGSLLPVATPADAAAAVAGIGAGAFAWFAVVAALARHGARVFERGVRRVRTAASLLLVGYGSLLLLRTGKLWLVG